MSVKERAERFDKTISALKLIQKGPSRCGHCGKVGPILAWREFPNMGLRVTCTMCGAKASVAVKAKHPVHRIAAAACYALKRQFNKTVAEELMK